MTGWLWRLGHLLTGRATGRDRPVLLVGVTIRVAGVLMLGYTLPLVWPHLPHPGRSALLALALAGQSTLVTLWWVRHRRVSAGALAVELPIGALALLFGPALDATEGISGWTDFAYPYTILLALTFGLCCPRLWWVLFAGACWSLAYVAGAVLVDGRPVGIALYGTIGYLVTPAVIWLCARLLRRGSDQIEAAHADAVTQTAVLATERERLRHARALHDRVMQTMETLARGRTVSDERLRGRITEQAAWLRWFVETGRVEQEADLGAGLAAAVRAAARDGIQVQLNDARLRAPAPEAGGRSGAPASGGEGRHPGVGAAGAPPGERPGAGLTPARRDVLVESVHHAVAAIAAREVVVCAVPEPDGVLVTVLATTQGEPLSAEDVTELTGRLARLGGRLTVDLMPYVELWVPVDGVSGAETPP